VRVRSTAWTRCWERGSYNNNDDIILLTLERVDRRYGVHPPQYNYILWVYTALSDELDISCIGREDCNLVGLNPFLN
jgi:hypothetical protein